MSLAASPDTGATAPTPTGTLARSLRPRHVAMISLGGVVGAGLFVGSSAAIQGAGPGCLVSYLLAGLICFLMMRMLGEMAVANPGRGSFNAYVGLHLGNRAAFVSGWLYWYFWVIVVGAEAIAGASLLHDALGAARSVPVWTLALLLIAGLTLTNLASVRSYGEFEFWFSLLKVGAIALFVLGGVAWLLVVRPSPGPLARLGSEPGWAPHGWLAIVAWVPTVIFSLTGSEIASIAAAESGDPARNVARAARTVALRILFFYLASILVILCIVPWGAIRPGHSPFVSAMDVMGMPGGQALMSLVVLIAVLSCLNSGLYVASRMLHELALGGDAPRAFAQVGRGRVPVAAILAASAVGVLAAFASVFSPDLVFAFLLNTSGAVILVIYAMIAFAQIRGRRRMRAAGDTPAFAVWWFPWTSYATVAAIGLVLLAMALLPSQRGQFAASLSSVVFVIAMSRIRSGGETLADDELNPVPSRLDRRS